MSYRKGLVVWIAGVMGCASIFAQTTALPLDPEAWVARWAAQYQSPEFAPINQALVYPNVEPNIAQRSNSVKPSKPERELLAVWRKVLDDHFKSLPKELTPEQIKLLKHFQAQTDDAYQQLIDHEINYASANRQLMQAYAEFSAASQALLQRMAQDKLKQENKASNFVAPLDPELQNSAQSAQKSYLHPSAESPQPSGLTPAQIQIKDRCKTEKIKLDQLMQEQQNWTDVTNSINEMLRDPYERERAQSSQQTQAVKREAEIATIRRFMDKNCHP